MPVTRWVPLGIQASAVIKAPDARLHELIQVRCATLACMRMTGRSDALLSLAAASLEGVIMRLKAPQEPMLPMPRRSTTLQYRETTTYVPRLAGSGVDGQATPQYALPCSPIAL